jgi:hypothetical protein
MTSKVYKTSQGKTVDLGALILQNENTRAVGNMNVNARGDVLDSSNQVIDQKNRQTQRQYQRQTTTESTPVATSARKAKKTQEVQPTVLEDLATAPAEATQLTGLDAAVARAQTAKKATE